MNLLEIVIITIISTLLIITLGNIQRQKDQIIIFMTMLAGLMIINLCLVKRQENFKFKNLSRLEIEKKLLNNTYKDPKFLGSIDPRSNLKNFKDLQNPKSKPVYSTEIIKLT